MSSQMELRLAIPSRFFNALVYSSSSSSSWLRLEDSYQFSATFPPSFWLKIRGWDEESMENPCHICKTLIRITWHKMSHQSSSRWHRRKWWKSSFHQLHQIILETDTLRAIMKNSTAGETWYTELPGKWCHPSRHGTCGTVLPCSLLKSASSGHVYLIHTEAQILLKSFYDPVIFVAHFVTALSYLSAFRRIFIM